ncbi:MBL fold metallo-hydrolase [Arthrobacter sp. NPDC090010]|uniref:MBL fold metallo-hydrolase n=1 Tax=Arthrobacter sp. NPDC090010 TaxID=3363942 RepID=UPI00380CC537
MTELNYTILDAPASSLHKTSVLITGETEAVLVDSGFTRADGHRIVAAVLDSGKTLTTVLISGGDPDFYFGAEVIADAFPGARFIAPSDVIDHIRHSYEGKLQAWAHLGSNLPTRLVNLEAFDGGVIHIDDRGVELRGVDDALGDRKWFVFEPEQRALLGGILLFEGLHVWTADSATTEARNAWLLALDAFDALAPTMVVAGHRLAGSLSDSTAITHTRAYLRRFEEVIAASADAASAEQSLLAEYPGAGLEIAASLGTKVAKGEMSWG